MIAAYAALTALPNPRFVAAALAGWGKTGAVLMTPDPENLFQLSNGTTAVTAAADPVGYQRDLSGNNKHATQATAGNRPLYGGKTTLSNRPFLYTSAAAGGLMITTGNMGACTVVTQTPGVGAVFTEGVSVTSTYTKTTQGMYGGLFVVVPGTLAESQKHLIRLQAARYAPALGAELVVNGTFDSGITGWTAGGTTASWDAGRMKLTANTGYCSMTQQFACNSGEPYLFSGDAQKGTTTTTFLHAGSTAGGTQYFDGRTTSQKSTIACAVTTGSPIYLTTRLSGQSDGGTGWVDNVSIRKVQ
jgi:hypothetical protein